MVTLVSVCVFHVCACCGHGWLQSFIQPACAPLPEACNVRLPADCWLEMLSCVISVQRVCWHMLSHCLITVTVVTTVSCPEVKTPAPASVTAQSKQAKNEEIKKQHLSVGAVNGVLCTDEINLSGHVETIIPAEKNIMLLLLDMWDVRSVRL